MPIFKFLHIASMFMYVGTGVGMELLLHRIAYSADVRTIRKAFELYKAIELIVPGFLVLGIIFGLTTAFTGQFNFTAPWLLIAYTLVVLIFLNGGAIGSVWLNKIQQAAEISPEEAPSAELRAVLDDKSGDYSMWANILLIIAIVFVMVFKPGGIAPLF